VGVRFVLLHSPVVGPTTWKWVASALRGDGHDVVVPDLVEVAQTGDPGAFATAAARAADRDEETLIVGHSGAGAVLPLIAAAMIEPPRRIVFVDAGLPPAAGVFTAGGGFMGTLRALARDGVLPRWSDWWAPGALETLVADKRRRATVEAELPQIPLSFYDTPIHVPMGWSDRSAAYLLLSEAYRSDASAAAALGWPVVERIGGHLDIVNDEAAIAAILTGFLDTPASP
jgi:hypothetical protein